jgi:phosphatidate cytidylyltransferase
VNGELWFLFFVTLTAVGDTSAYLIGQQWGKHKMGQRVSPNKSWEGYAAGIVSAILMGLGFSVLAGGWFKFTPVWGMVFAGLLYAVIPIGDFGISMFKRWAGVKNTSNLLPGHGGILDRIDTHLWTMALGYHILKWLVFAG